MSLYSIVLVLICIFIAYKVGQSKNFNYYNKSNYRAKFVAINEMNVLEKQDFTIDGKIALVEGKDLKVKSIMNTPETAFYWTLLKHVKGFLIVPELALGAFAWYEELEDGKNTHKTFPFSSLRLDFAIVDKSTYKVVMAIEHNGDGHNIRENIEQYDKLKRTILEKINIPLVVIEHGSKFEDIVREQVIPLLQNNRFIT